MLLTVLLCRLGITCWPAGYNCEVPSSHSKKTPSAIIATEVPACVDLPNATYLELLCCCVDLKQRNIVDPYNSVALVVPS